MDSSKGRLQVQGVQHRALHDCCTQCSWWAPRSLWTMRHAVVWETGHCDSQGGDLHGSQRVQERGRRGSLLWCTPAQLQGVCHMPHACRACRKPALKCRQAPSALQSGWAHPAALPTYLDGICEGHDVDMVRLLSHGLHKATTEGLHAQQIITHALHGRLNISGCP